MSSISAVAIDPFSAVAGTVTVDGLKHDVLHLTGREYRKLDSEATTVLDCFAIAERIVPSLGDKVYDFTDLQIGAIVGVAVGRVKDVELQFPNSSGPTLPNDSATPAQV